MSNAESSTATTKVRSKHSLKTLWGVYWLRKEKYSMGRIAQTIGISKATVQTIVDRIRDTGTPVPQPRPGRKKKILDERELRVLEHIVRSSPFASYDRINFEFKTHQKETCRATLIKYIKQLGFDSYFAPHKPKLGDEQKKKRLHWAKERVNWSLDDWRRVVWSDESRFAVEGYDGGARVLRKKGERYEKEYMYIYFLAQCTLSFLTACEWAKDTILDYIKLFKFQQSPLNQQTEGDVLRRIWFFLDTVLDDSRINCIGGEKSSKSSSAGRNANRVLAGG